MTDDQPDAVGDGGPDDAHRLEDDFILEEGPETFDGEGTSPERDAELEEELLPAQLEEASFAEREPVRIAAAVAGAGSLVAAAAAAVGGSRWAPAFAALAVGGVVAGELARARVTPMAAPQLATD